MTNYTISFEAMGSTVNVWLNAPGQADAAILKNVPYLFNAWENRFSRFRPSSELCRLNAGAGTWQDISPLMAEVLSLAINASAETGGLFNPLILQALEAAGYDHNFDDPAAFQPAPGDNVADVPDYHQIELDRHNLKVRLPANGRLDLGGIVKGWAAQKTAEYLSRVGACLVDAGGDMVARGTPDDTGGWLVNIPPPHDENLIDTVLLKDAAISTSGKEYRHWIRGGETLHH